MSEGSHHKWSCWKKLLLLLYGAFTRVVDGVAGLIVVTMSIEERTVRLALWECDKAVLMRCCQSGAGFCFFIVMLAFGMLLILFIRLGYEVNEFIIFYIKGEIVVVVIWKSLSLFCG